MRNITGCPILAASLYLQLGWDTTNSNRSPIQEELGAPGPSHLGTGDTAASRCSASLEASQ
jgi:hypothetical protein